MSAAHLVLSFGAITGHRRSSPIPGWCDIFDPVHQVALLPTILFCIEGTK